MDDYVIIDGKKILNKPLKTSIIKHNMEKNLMIIDLKIRIEKHLKLISHLANEYDGYFFGGIVRDFFVSGTDAKDIDIWFQKETNADLFIEILRSETNIEILRNNIISSNIPEYDFLRKQFIITMPDNCEFILDLIISQSYPVNDFFNNELIYKHGKICHYNDDMGLLEIILDLIKSRILLPKNQYLLKFKVFYDNNSMPSYVSHSDMESKNLVLQTMGLRLISFKLKGWFIPKFEEYFEYTSDEHLKNFSLFKLTIRGVHFR